MVFMANPRRSLAIIFGLGAAYLGLILLTRNSYYQLMLTMLPIWAVVGLSWNILSGYSGSVSFGHAAFFGLGAYTMTLLLLICGISPWIGVPAAALAGCIAALLIGFVTFRLRGPYFSLAMLAYPLALLYVFQWAGFQELSLPMERAHPAAYMQFADQRWNAVIALGLLVIALLVSLWIQRSRFGLSLLAIRQNELAAEAAGVNVRAWKLKAIAISGAAAGAAGALYTVFLLVITPDGVFGVPVSAQAMIIAMFGGSGTLWGPLIGAAILIPLSETLQAVAGGHLPGIQGDVFGIAIILVIRLMPHGLFWTIRDSLRRRGDALLPVLQASRSAPSKEQPVAAAVGSIPLLEVNGLCRSFGGLRALSDLSLAIYPSEILGIIGPNGAGKTTLFNTLNGLVRPQKGSIRLSRLDLTRLRPNQICALGVGRTFQVVRVFPNMSLLENVVVGAFVRAAKDTQALHAAREALCAVGLEELAAYPAERLTNYQLRLMELARALAGAPRLLLMDEPFAGLAPEETDMFITLIRALRAQGLTIAVIEHTMHVMVRLVDRFVVLDHGSVIANGAPQSVIRDSNVIKAYLGDKWMQHAGA